MIGQVVKASAKIRKLVNRVPEGEITDKIFSRSRAQES